MVFQMLLRGECYENVYAQRRTNCPSFKVLNGGSYTGPHIFPWGRGGCWKEIIVVGKALLIICEPILSCDKKVAPLKSYGQFHCYLLASVSSAEQR
jgi:hypothetical protein